MIFQVKFFSPDLTSALVEKRAQALVRLRPLIVTFSMRTGDNNNNNIIIIIIIIVIIIAPVQCTSLCTDPSLPLQVGFQQSMAARLLHVASSFFTWFTRKVAVCVCVCASILKMLHFHQNFQIGRVVQITQLYTKFVSRCQQVI